MRGKKKIYINGDVALAHTATPGRPKGSKKKPWRGWEGLGMHDITIELLTQVRKDYIFPADSLDMEATKWKRKIWLKGKCKKRDFQLVEPKREN